MELLTGNGPPFSSMPGGCSRDCEVFVVEDENGILSIKPADLVFPLITTVQKLNEKVKELSRKSSEVT